VEQKRRRLKQIIVRLHVAYPDARCALVHQNPFELIVSTILSAQCTDKRVNMVTPALFAKYPNAPALAKAKLADVEGLIRSTGFYKNKAKNLLGLGQQLVSKHGGEVPKTIEELVLLPGVGRKTANVVLGNAFGIPAGVVVDTHVTRISRLLKLTHATSAEKIEQDLNRLTAPETWVLLPHLLIEHGRRVCVARRPRCGECAIAEFCPSRY
jgi:endonuclease-3